MMDLGTLGGGYSVACEVNERGQVAGEGLTAEGEWHAFLWSQGVMTDLGTLTGETGFSALCSSHVPGASNVLNDEGQVVGAGATADGVIHAFLWSRAEMKDLMDYPIGGGACTDD